MEPQIIYASVSDEYTDALIVNGREIGTDNDRLKLADQLADALGVPTVVVSITMDDVLAFACRDYNYTSRLARAAVQKAEQMGLVPPA